MKFIWITAVIVIALAAGAAGVGYLCMRGGHAAMTGHDDSMLWLRSEFKLDAAQLAEIEKVHEAYQSVCEDHCALIMEQRAKLRRLKSEGAPEADIAAAQAEAKRLDENCRASLEAHVRQIAGLIGGAQGERYLKTILPRIARFDHTGSPNLSFSPNEKGPHDGHAAH